MYVLVLLQKFPSPLELRVYIFPRILPKLGIRFPQYKVFFFTASFFKTGVQSEYFIRAVLLNRV